jgi:DNA-binding SARP family transcriptional activator/tetratricopeptide (TPR) repeat protein
MLLTVFGSVSVLTDGERRSVPRAQTRGVLAHLALNAGRTVTRDGLTEAMWGGAEPSTARTQIHNAVAVVRRTLVECRQDDVLVSTTSGYRLDVDPLEVDALRFEGLLSAARVAVADGRPQRAAGLIRSALTLWVGEPLAGAAGAFVESARARLVERRLTAVEELAALDLGPEHAETVLAELTPLVDAFPTRERLRARQLAVLHRTGRKVEALQAFRTYRRLLAEAEGLDPGLEIAQLATAILRGDAPAPDDSATAPAARAAPRSGAAWLAPSMLPPDITDFTGREDQIARLVGVLGARDAAVGLVVGGVSGMGGVGKSTLQVHVAHQLAGQFPDGQLYAALRGADRTPLEPAEVLGRFLRATGVDSGAVPQGLDERAGLFRTRLSGRRVLVVLDDASSEEQVRPLLPGSASCAVLLSSRRRLGGVESARWVDLDVFDAEQALRLLATIAEPARILAQRLDASEVVALCGYLPLAVRVAGARLTARPTWPVAHLAHLLRDQRQRLDRLSTGDLAVRASLALSYEGLDDEARRLFRLLGLFDAHELPAWLCAATLSTSQPDADEVAERLVDAQLLEVVGSANGQVRYRLHDLVRLYAYECAQVEETAQTRRAALERGFGAWLATAERMAQTVPGPCYAVIHGPAARTQPDWGEAGLDDADPLAWFDTEHAALLATIRQAAVLGLCDVAFDLAGCLEKYHDVRGMYVEWRDANEHVMEACERAGNRLGQAVMLRGLIDVRAWNTPHRQGDAMSTMHDDARRLRQLFAELEEPRGIADAEVLLSWACSAGGDLTGAFEHATTALRLAEDSEHVGGVARAHAAIALAHHEQHDLGRAVAHLEQALAAARASGSVRYESTVLQFLGMARFEAGDHDAAERALAQSLTISHAHDDRYVEALTLLAVARVHAAQGAPDAAALARESLALGREYAMDHHVAHALTALAEIEIAQGHADQARAHLEEALALWRTRGWPSFTAWCLIALGTAARARDPKAAVTAWSEARALLLGLGRAEAAAELDDRIDEAAAGQKLTTG